MTYNGLLRLGQRTNEIELDLAESWKQLDDRTYEFKLRKGVHWHNIPPVNGRELTSADVKYSIERMSGMYDEKFYLFNHRYYFRDKLESIETPDKYTVIFKTKQPYAPFINYIASMWSKIVPREAVEEFGDLKRDIIGTGPFIYDKEASIPRQKLVFKKNPNYFRKGYPYLDGVEMRIIPNPQTAFSAFLAGELDSLLIYTFQVPTAEKELSNDHHCIRVDANYTYILRTAPWIDGQEIKPPFNDKRVRQATAYAIDKEKLMELSISKKEYGQMGVGAVPQAFQPWALPKSEAWPYDPEKAKKLLAEAGYPNGFTVDLITWNAPDRTRPMQVIQQMLTGVGIKAQLKVMEMAQYFNLAYKFDYQLAFHTTTAGYDPSEWLVSYFGKGATYYKWADKELWDIIEKQEMEMDPKKRLELVQKAQRMVMDEAMSQSLYSTNYNFVFQPYVHFKVYAHEGSGGMYEFYWYDK
jgi:peptide/nickel transport system substrate-binding protein